MPIFKCICKKTETVNCDACNILYMAELVKTLPPQQIDNIIENGLFELPDDMTPRQMWLIKQLYPHVFLV